MKVLVAVGLLFPLGMLISTTLSAREFCEASPAVEFDIWVSHRESHIGQRVRFDATLRTDGKEFTVLQAGEGGGQILMTSDDESDAYRERWKVPDRFVPGTYKDLNSKIDQLGRDGRRLQPPTIRYYRQEVTVCGRIVNDDGLLKFAVDDMITVSSYLIMPNGNRAAEYRFGD
ncbi:MULTISPECIES: hypothetical protein [Dyella]|uniref:Uncharacterized protein n=2 Tax=Dyella TaxID=231454 RepID=A0A4R0YJN9_9GAMM|nr:MULTISPECIES: hypothetical protein [Dyella]TBR36091.1 hypothetical protein EYV96_15925 [Dyella terrae]TCI06140.1 hypothetical protein EZM97_35015 [Dyella soli]